MDYYELENELLRIDMQLTKTEQPLALLTIITDTLLVDGTDTDIFKAMSGELSALVGFDVATEPVEKTHESLMSAVAAGGRKIYQVLHDLLVKILNYFKSVMTSVSNLGKQAKLISSKITAEKLDFNKEYHQFPTTKVPVILDLLGRVGDAPIKAGWGMVITKDNKYFSFENDMSNGIYRINIHSSNIWSELFITGTLTAAGYKDAADIGRVSRDIAQALAEFTAREKHSTAHLQTLERLTEELAKEEDKSYLRKKIEQMIGTDGTGTPENRLRYQINMIRETYKLDRLLVEISQTAVNRMWPLIKLM